VDEIGQGRRVRCGSAAVAGYEKAGLLLVEELLGVDVRERRDAEAGFADQLGQHSARPEGDERAERRVLHDAGEELGPARDHLLDDHGLADSLGCLADGSLVAEIEGNASRLGLVRAGDGRLDHDREPELSRRLDGFIDRLRDPFVDERQAV
jgi:hypothetical protein